jgi:hypothetical protein
MKGVQAVGNANHGSKTICFDFFSRYIYFIRFFQHIIFDSFIILEIIIHEQLHRGYPDR